MGPYKLQRRTCTTHLEKMPTQLLPSHYLSISFDDLYNIIFIQLDAPSGHIISRPEKLIIFINVVART